MVNTGDVTFENGIYTMHDGYVTLQNRDLILAQPDHNFMIQVDFKTTMDNCGLFSFHFNGHDRHFALK